MRIELDTADNYIDVDGIRISLVLLQALANPEENVMYQMVREGDQITVQRFKVNQA